MSGANYFIKNVLSCIEFDYINEELKWRVELFHTIKTCLKLTLVYMSCVNKCYVNVYLTFCRKICFKFEIWTLLGSLRQKLLHLKYTHGHFVSWEIIKLDLLQYLWKVYKRFFSLISEIKWFLILLEEGSYCVTIHSYINFIALWLHGWRGCRV